MILDIQNTLEITDHIFSIIGTMVPLVIMVIKRKRDKIKRKREKSD